MIIPMNAGFVVDEEILSGVAVSKEMPTLQIRYKSKPENEGIARG